MKNTKCESCLMPLSKDTGVSGNEKYCSYCWKDGKFVYEGTDVKEFKKHSYEAMRLHGMSKIKASIFAWMIGFAPRWKK